MERKARRDQILRCAKAVFAAKGYHAASVSDIVTRARVARGTFYLHFDGKRDAFGALVDGLLQELDARIRAVDLGPGQPPPLEQVKDNVRRVLELMVHDPHNMRLLLQNASALDRRTREVQQKFFDGVHALIERSLAQGAEMGLLRPCDLGIVSSCALGTIKEVTERLARAGGDVDLDAVAAEIVQFGLHGVALTRK